MSGDGSCGEGLDETLGYLDLYSLHRKEAPLPAPLHWSCLEPPPAASGMKTPTVGIGQHHTCFEYHPEALSWEKAEHTCIQQGMHLASIHSAEENRLVLGLCSLSCWIGFTDMDVEGVWRWTDGSSSKSDQPWNTGDFGETLPSRKFLSDEVTDGAFMYARANGWTPFAPGSWDDDVQNTTARPFVCRRDFRQAAARGASTNTGGAFSVLVQIGVGACLTLCGVRAWRSRRRPVAPRIG